MSSNENDFQAMKVIERIDERLRALGANIVRV